MIGQLYGFQQQMVEYPPDVYRNGTEIIRDKGYPVEEHRILTADGFLLLSLRIPHGRDTNNHYDNNAPKKLVIVQPGLVSAGEFMVSDWDRNLPYVLADTGFDVWILNSRNVPEPSHKILKPTDKRAWDWSIDEFAAYDIPAAVDYILAATSRPTISAFIAHSQGGTIGFAAFSSNDVLAKKVELFIPLGSPAGSKLIKQKQTRSIFDIICTSCRGSDGALWPGCCAGVLGTRSNFTFTIDACYRFPTLCAETICLAVGCESSSNFNKSRLSVWIAHYPSLTSTKNLEHWNQMSSTGIFKKFDYGKQENLIRYNSTIPPSYQLSKLATDIVIVGGLHDSASDIPFIVNNVPSEKLITVIQPPYGHLEYAFSLNAKEILWAKLINIINQR